MISNFMFNIITIIGARPQFIKAAPVSSALKNMGINEHLVHTGQHYDYEMSEVFFKELNLPSPRYHLNCGGGTHGEMTAKMLTAIEQIVMSGDYHAIMVYGDTNSTLAGALSAAKCHLPVIHVEAGLRSFNRKMPEEVNRVITDHLSSLLLCSSSVGVDNLLREGIDINGIKMVGDVMADAQQIALDLVRKSGNRHDVISSIEGDFGLITMHRAENTDSERVLTKLVGEINASKHSLVFPLHPRTRRKLVSYGLKFEKHVRTIEPVGYLDMVYLLDKCQFVITDSGGLQKEAYWAKKPCITMRGETEWTETLDAGANQLLGERSLNDVISNLNYPSDAPQLYGEGEASEKIAKEIYAFMNSRLALETQDEK